MKEYTIQEQVIKSFKLLKATIAITNDLILEDECFNVNLQHNQANDQLITRLTDAFLAKKHATETMQTVYGLHVAKLKEFTTQLSKQLASEINSLIAESSDVS